jgi:hypothetical protein
MDELHKIPMPQKKIPPNLRISPAEVVAYVSTIVAAKGLTYDRDHKCLLAAICVLGRFFGHDWVDSRVLRKSGFLRPPVTRPFDEFKMQDRIVTLAEHLVNLQEIDGFSWCLNEIRTETIETGLGKLIAAGMLRRRDIPFHFVVPSGRLGHDYDAEAIIGATTVAIEMKSKVEGNDPSPEAVLNTLKRARKQLPRRTPNLVFLRVPGAWGENEIGVRAITRGVVTEFERSRTIGLVVAHWEYWWPSPTIDEPQGVERSDRQLVIGSRQARVGLAALEKALLGVPASDMFPWLSLQDLFPG